MAASPDAYWIALRQVHGVGARTAMLLIGKFETPERIFGLSEQELAGAGIPMTTARAIAGFRDFGPAERELCELPRLGARMVKWTDADYPPNLRHIADPPPYLFVRGTLDLAHANCIAIVGARAASEAGRRMAQRLGFELGAKGFVVVSGLARGIDGEAHQGALDAGGLTAAVMGCGIDVIYPREHRAMAEAIVERGGALMSELPVGTQPLGENFPTRNRILSGLCLGVVVVEAAEKSGSLITARMALEQNRQVFAVPGSPLGGKARGNNRLIRDGAVLVECVEDVLEELAPQLAPHAPVSTLSGGMTVIEPPRTGHTAAPAPSASSPALGIGTSLSNAPQVAVPLVERLSVKPVRVERRSTDATNESKEAATLLGCLKRDERLHVDSLIEASGLNAQTVLRLLLELELKGFVTQHPGKLFSLA